MVYCTKCGAKNEETSETCSHCGAVLQNGSVRSDVSHKIRQERNDCFGLPNGGAVFGLIIGTLIILWGLSQILGWDLGLGTIAIIIIGILIVAGAIYGFTRDRS